MSYNNLIQVTANVSGACGSSTEDYRCSITTNVIAEYFNNKPKAFHKEDFGGKYSMFTRWRKSKEYKKYLAKEGLSEKMYLQCVDLFWDHVGFAEAGFRVTLN